MGAGRLAQSLVAQRLLSDAQVAGALQRQALIGAGLDTNILELQLLTEPTCLAAMALAFAVEAVDKTRLESVAPHLARLFPAFVRDYDLLPLRLEEQTLTVVGCAPPDAERLRRIWEQYRLRVVFCVAVEVRLRAAMQRLYGLLPEPRFVQLGVLLDGLQALPAAPAGKADATRARALQDALARLDADLDPDAALEVVLSFACSLFDWVGIFVLHGTRPHARTGAAGCPSARLEGIDVPLIKAALERTLLGDGGAYSGTLPEDETRARFLRHIGRPPPRAVCVSPILVGGRMAALVYADKSPTPPAAAQVTAFTTVLQRCGLAWERLILRRKQGAVAGAKAAPDAIAPAKPGAAAAVSPGPVGCEPGAPRERPGPPYVMFSDITDSPQQTLSDWEDVYVETSRLDDNAPGDTSGPAPHDFRWSDVIALARSAGRFVPQRTTLPPYDTAQLRRLIAALDTASGPGRQGALAQLLNAGALADAACSEAFPGRLDIDVRAADTMLPPFDRCSGLCHLLARRGQEATPVVLPHLASDDFEKRLLAVYFFQAVHDSAGCPGLTLRLYDSEKRVRNLAVETLRYYKNDLAYAYTIQELRRQLHAPEARRFAIQTLGQLREVFAVPALIPLVGDSDRDTARAAASALAVICGQAFGADVERWQNWWQQHHYRPRPSWLLEGLSHANPTIRRVAHHELQHITGQVLDFDPQASVREREQRTQVWQHWLQTHDLDVARHPTIGRA